MENAAQPKTPRVLLIELNEVNRDLLVQACRHVALPNISKVVGSDESHTTTNDEYDSGYLEPWVQWVSVHTGRPSAEHRVMHLGDVPEPSSKQIWETLSDQGVHSGVWGVMNGVRRGAPSCDFFVADPWTFVEDPYPANLIELVSFARYLAKNYLHLSPVEMVRQSIIYLFGLLKNVSVPELFQATSIFLEGLFRFGPKQLVLGAFFEYLSAIAFLKYKRLHNPQLSIVFLNLIAHIQHRFWLSSDSFSAELVYGFKVIDKILGKLFAQTTDGELVLMANALSQVNTLHEDTWILYRPIDPEGFVRAMGIDCERVEALMTYDAHAFFRSVEECNRAFETVKEASINGRRLFFVDRGEPNSTKFFYRVDFSEPISLDAVFEFGGTRWKFADYFSAVGTRTGKHGQTGFVFQSHRIMPQSLLNHEIHDHICAYLCPSVPKWRATNACADVANSS